jgi:hypothetical protein
MKNFEAWKGLSVRKVCECGEPIAIHNSNRGITECHECLDKTRKSEALVRKFLDDLFESNSVEEWEAKLNQSPEVGEWAVKQFKENGDGV